MWTCYCEDSFEFIFKSMKATTMFYFNTVSSQCGFTLFWRWQTELSVIKNTMTKNQRMKKILIRINKKKKLLFKHKIKCFSKNRTTNTILFLLESESPQQVPAPSSHRLLWVSYLFFPNTFWLLGPLFCSSLNLLYTSHFFMGFNSREIKTEIWISFSSFIRSCVLPQEKIFSYGFSFCDRLSTFCTTLV